MIAGEIADCRIQLDGIRFSYLKWNMFVGFFVIDHTLDMIGEIITVIRSPIKPNVDRIIEPPADQR